jgi:hypothetical protein
MLPVMTIRSDLAGMVYSVSKYLIVFVSADVAAASWVFAVVAVPLVSDFGSATSAFELHAVITTISNAMIPRFQMVFFIFFLVLPSTSIDRLIVIDNDYHY